MVRFDLAHGLSWDLYNELFCSILRFEEEAIKLRLIRITQTSVEGGKE